MKPPTREEIRRIVSKSRMKSIPGPNGILLLFKKCTKVFKWHAWKNFQVSNQWMIADGVYIPKEKISKDIDYFCPISFLKVKGKIFSLFWHRD